MMPARMLRTNMLRTRLFPALVALVLCVAVAPRASAQRPHPERRGLAPRMGAIQGGNPQRRAMLERQFRQRGEQIVRQRLGLNDAQMRQLRQVNQQMNARRRALMLQELDTRAALRAEVAKGSGADQARVAQLIAQAQALQRQRFAVAEDEQKALSAFLTPVQQAQYVGLQEQLRQRLRQLRQKQGGGEGIPQP